MTVADRVKGAWFARWSNWGVRAAWTPSGWEVKVWRWRRGRSIAAQVLLATESGLADFGAAMTAAWTVMKKDGAQIFVLDAPEGFSPTSLLPFRPASEAFA